MESIDSILKGDAKASEPAPAPEPTPEPTPEPAPTGEAELQQAATTDGTPRDDKGRFAPKADKPAEATATAAPPAAKKDAGEGLNAALLAERRQRQQLERRLAELEAKPAQPAPKPPDFFEDPNKFREHLEGTVTDRLVNMSVAQARLVHPDFNEVFPAWEHLTKANPGLYEAAIQSDHPGEYAYQACKRAMAFQKIGDPTTYRDRVADELLNDEKFLEKVRAKLGAAPPAAQSTAPAAPALPPSLATARNAGSRSGPAWNGPQPIGAILGQR